MSVQLAVEVPDAETARQSETAGFVAPVPVSHAVLGAAGSLAVLGYAAGNPVADTAIDVAACNEDESCCWKGQELASASYHPCPCTFFQSIAHDSPSHGNLGKCGS